MKQLISGLITVAITLGVCGCGLKKALVLPPEHDNLAHDNISTLQK